LTYAYNPITISNILNIPKTVDFAQQLRNKIKCFPSARQYTTKLIDLAVKSLHPDPEKRASVSQLMQYISEESILAPEISQHLEDDYIVITEISNLAITSLQEIESPGEKRVPFPVLGSTVPNEDEVLSLFLVENKQTSKRYNAFCITFRREKHAIEYYNDHWKYRISLNHENIVPIEAAYFQRTSDGRSQVCLVKVCIIFY
jgi:serine/threonine protein kinase